MFNFYRNLNKPGNFSIREKGKVIGWSPVVLLDGNIGFHVGESGRLRVIRDRRKNVHSWIKAKSYEILNEVPSLDGYMEIYYDPYFTQFYYCTQSGKKLASAKRVLLANNRAYAYEPSYIESMF